MNKATLAKKKSKAATGPDPRQMAAGEFKAKCLAIMDEVYETGRPLVVTKRGEPVIEVFPARNRNKKKDSISFGNRYLYLFSYCSFKQVRRIRYISACINKLKFLPCPLNFTIVTVSRYPA